MKKLSLLLALGLAVTAAVAMGVDDDAATLTRINGYQQWSRINTKPVEVPVQIASTSGTIDFSKIDTSSVAV